jgi:hypothetical protein
MDYDAVIEVFFQPSPLGIVPAPVAAGSPARRLRDALEPIAMHSVWSRTTNERLAGFGLDFLGAYVWGRAAALGEPDAGAVVSSFAVFEPGMITTTYEHARSACPRATMLAARAEATIASLGTTLGDADVTPVTDRLAAAAALRAAGLLDGDALTAAGRRARDELEATTDAMERPIVESLGADLDAVIDQLAHWSELCIAAQAFPPDAFKRAAG